MYVQLRTRAGAVCTRVLQILIAWQQDCQPGSSSGGAPGSSSGGAPGSDDDSEEEWDTDEEEEMDGFPGR